MTVTGIIGVPSAEHGRYASCAASLIALQSPPRTARMPAIGANVAENRNLISEQALIHGAEWILYVDDDQILPPDTLMRLLAHDRDIVSALYVKRQMPFEPLMYDREDERGFCFQRLLTPLSGGLVEVVATGAGCLLVKTRVLRKMAEEGLAGDGKEWWQLGQIVKSGWCDDMNFCHRAREAGFQVWCDLNTRVGHQINGTVWPVRKPSGDWVTQMLQSHSGEPIAEWPAAQQRPSELIASPDELQVV